MGRPSTYDRAPVSPRRTVAPQQSGVTTLHQERTPEEGVIRLERWPEGYVLWHHGSIVWRSFRR